MSEFDDFVPLKPKAVAPVSADDFADFVPVEGGTSVAPQAVTSANVPQLTGPLRPYAQFSSAALNGLVHVLGIPGDIGNAINSGLSRATGMAQLPESGFSGSGMEHMMQGAGLVDRPDLVPQNGPERFNVAAGAGFGGGGPISMAGGLGSQAAHEVSPSTPGLDDLLGGLTGGAIGSQALATHLPNVISAFDRLGVKPGLTSVVSDNPAARGLEWIANKLPFGKGHLTATAQELNNNIAGAAENVASKLGKSTSLQEAGTVLQKEAQDWIDNVGDKHAAVWDPVNAAIPADTPVDISKYRDAINANRDRLSAFANTVKTVSPGAAKDLEGSLDKDFPAGPGGAQTSDGSVRMPGGGNYVPPQPTWKDVQGLRSMFGELRGDPGAIEKIGDKNLSRIYASLSDTLGDTAEKNGVGDLFDKANMESSRLYDIQKNIMYPIIDTDPEKAAAKLMAGAKNGSSSLDVIRGELPTAADELGAYHIRNTVANSTNAPRDIARAYSGAGPNRLTPESYNALFAGDQGVSDLGTVANASTPAVEKYLGRKHLDINPLGIYMGSILGADTVEHMGSPLEILGHAVTPANALIAGGVAGTGPLAARLSTANPRAFQATNPNVRGNLLLGTAGGYANGQQ